MDSFLTVLSTLGSIGGVFGPLIAWVALKPEQRVELRKILKRLWEHSTKILPVLLAAFTAGMNIWEIYAFGKLDTVPTRQDILVLLMNIWNAASYFFFGMVLFIYWLKDVIKKDFPFQAQT